MEPTAEPPPYAAVDLAKFVCALLVIAIHTQPPETQSTLLTNEVVNVLGRIAVPFFFVCSGYFFLAKLTRANARERFVKYVKELLWLYAAWCCIYFPIDAYLGWKRAPNALAAVLGYLQNLVFAGGHSHLWYLPALLLATTLLYASFVVDRLLTFLVASLALYGVGLFGDAYSGLLDAVPWAQKAYSAYFEVFLFTRNGLFFGFPFVMLGGVAARWQAVLERRATLGVLVALAVLLHLEAALLARHGGGRDCNMYITLLPLALCLLLVLLRTPLGIRPATARTMRSLSSGVYFAHGLFVAVFSKVFQLAGLEGAMGAYFLAVALSSVWVVLQLMKSERPYLRRLVH